MYDIDTLFSFRPYRVAMVAYAMFFQLWYFLGIGIAVGVAFNVFMPPGKINWIYRNANSTRAIIVAALLGAISPLGSYAVIPTFATLLRIGMPLATVMAFLASSPLINPFIFTMTFQILGPKMAFARLLSAIIVGILTGSSFKYLEHFWPLQNNFETITVPSFFAKGLRTSNPIDVCDNSSALDAKCEKFVGVKNAIPARNKWKTFFIECLKMTRYTGKWFVISIILAAVVDVYVPNDWIVRSLGGHTYSILLAVAMAIPFYVCGGGAVPLVLQLMHSGMDQGAALAFFIAGPVTRISPMATVVALVGYRSLVVYFVISMFTAFILGFLYHFV
jgi:hypothetical protein